jgi:hypothetical protein
MGAHVTPPYKVLDSFIVSLTTAKKIKKQQEKPFLGVHFPTTPHTLLTLKWSYVNTPSNNKQTQG